QGVALEAAAGDRDAPGVRLAVLQHGALDRHGAGDAVVDVVLHPLATAHAHPLLGADLGHAPEVGRALTADHGVVARGQAAHLVAAIGAGGRAEALGCAAHEARQGDLGVGLGALVGVV